MKQQPGHEPGRLALGRPCGACGASMTRRYDFQLGITHGARFWRSLWRHEVDFPICMDSLTPDFSERAHPSFSILILGTSRHVGGVAWILRGCDMHWSAIGMQSRSAVDGNRRCVTRLDVPVTAHAWIRCESRREGVTWIRLQKRPALSSQQQMDVDMSSSSPPARRPCCSPPGDKSSCFSDRAAGRVVWETRKAITKGRRVWPGCG